MAAKAESRAIDRSMDELERIVERVRALGASAEDAQVLEDLVASYAWMTDLIRDKQTTISRLRQMLFGSTSERSEKVLGPAGGEEAATAAPPVEPGPAAKGHGRNGAHAYTGARKVPVPHGTLRPGSGCPHCQGMLCAKGPARLVRIAAAVPFSATVYERERLRCNLCGEVYTAKAPEGVGEEKYDETVPSMIATLRYGSGLPLNRIEQVQEAAGVPLPASTQWDLLERAAPGLEPLHVEFVRQAAQGEVLHNDDTPMVILAYLKEEKERRERGEKPSERTGVFTTGIVAVIAGGRRIVLYATGRRHAGENLLEVLKHRAPSLPAPMQMCDGLERNLPGELKTIVGNCLAHGRRQFVDVVSSFPREVRHLLEELALVYRADERTRAQGLSPQERLALHQEESGPVMARLKTWLDGLIEEKKVEPNSVLGKAILYMQNRWERMTLFLREAGAPLDNNLCERMLKRAILHRKNSLFYKTENGARVGDLFMSLIATARMAKADPFDYLTETQRHTRQVAADPAQWMPWCYRQTLARTDGPAP